MNGWIPINYNKETKRFEGKKPNNYERVLISTERGLVHVDTFFSNLHADVFPRCSTDCIKAWMPLPEPYEGT